MKPINLILILAMSISLMSCIKRTVKNDGLNSSTIESMEGPKVIRDTIIKEIIIEKEVERASEIVQQQPDKPVVPAPKPVATSPSAPKPKAEDRNDSYNKGNSGFFDQYQQNYDGDPNRNLKTTTRIVDDGAGDADRKKDVIEKSLNALEKKNQQQKDEYNRYEKDRQAANARAIQEAKEANDAQQKKAQQQKANRGKTLDTDLLLK